MIVDLENMFYNTEEIAEILGCCTKQARKIMHQKDFPLTRVGRSLKVYKPDFEKWANTPDKK